MNLTKFQLPSLKTVVDYLVHMPGHFRNYILRSAYLKKSGCGYPDIRIAQNIRTHEVIIHTKFQLPRLKGVAYYRGQRRLPAFGLWEIYS